MINNKLNTEKNQNQSPQNQGNWWLVFGVIILAVLPLLFVKGEYGGTDGEAQEVITEMKPDYQPWFQAIFEPPSAEIENLLFVTQGVIGAGIIGYTIGFYKGKTEKEKN